MDQLILPLLLGALVVFMIFNARRRTRTLRAQAEEKATKTVPGARVLLQGGIYGTIVSYDNENLDRPAEIEIAPGVVIDVHSQAILRVVDETEDEPALEEIADTAVPDDASSLAPETPEETRARLERDAKND